MLSREKYCTLRMIDVTIETGARRACMNRSKLGVVMLLVNCQEGGKSFGGRRHECLACALIAEGSLRFSARYGVFSAKAVEPALNLAIQNSRGYPPWLHIKRELLTVAAS